MNSLTTDEDWGKQLASLPDAFREAHRHSIHHRAEIEASAPCGCFYCCSVFPPGEITDWGNTYESDTTACPFCGIDSVIGSASNHLITLAFLMELKKHWFN